MRACLNLVLSLGSEDVEEKVDVATIHSRHPLMHDDLSCLYVCVCVCVRVRMCVLFGGVRVCMCLGVWQCRRLPPLALCVFRNSVSSNFSCSFKVGKLSEKYWELY